MASRTQSKPAAKPAAASAAKPAAPSAAKRKQSVFSTDSPSKRPQVSQSAQIRAIAADPHAVSREQRVNRATGLNTLLLEEEESSSSEADGEP